LLKCFSLSFPPPPPVPFFPPFHDIGQAQEGLDLSPPLLSLFSFAKLIDDRDVSSPPLFPPYGSDEMKIEKMQVLIRPLVLF